MFKNVAAALLTFGAALVGGAGGGYIYVTSTASADTNVPAAVAATETHQEMMGEDISLAIIKTGQIIVPVIKQDKTTAYVMAEFALEAKDEASAQVIENRMPYVRDALIETMISLVASGHVGGTSLDRSVVSTQVVRAANRSLGDKHVKRALFDSYFRQSQI